MDKIIDKVLKDPGKKKISESKTTSGESQKHDIKQTASDLSATGETNPQPLEIQPQEVSKDPVTEPLPETYNNQATVGLSEQHTKAKEDYQTEIIEAVNRSQHLINYATEAGKEIEPEISETITEFSHKVIINDKAWTAKEESNFRYACSRLSTSLSPVTYDTLASSTIMAKEYTKWFGILTIIFLAILIYSQFIWVLLSNATKTIDDRLEDIEVANVEKEILDFRADTYKNDLVILNAQLNATKRSITGTNTQIKERKKSLTNDIENNRQAILKNERKLHDSQEQVDTSTKILVGWLPFQGWLRTTRPPDPGFWDNDQEVEAKLTKIKAWDTAQKQESSFRNTALHVWAKQILQGMSAYFLPLLYGLVGACAYVLRSMSCQMRELTFSTTGSTLQFMLRLILGALAGIAIGWFLKPEASSTDLISSLSPLALAFIAGYSVELVFTAMDKVIVAFTGSGPGEQREMNGKREKATI